VNNERFRLDFNHGHDLVQIEKLKDRGAAFPEVYVFKLGRQFGTLWQKFGRKMTSLGAMATKLVAKLSSALLICFIFLIYRKLLDPTELAPVYLRKERQF
jgi:hypothetical protein